VDGQQMWMKKVQSIKERDPDWIIEIAVGLLDRDINDLSDHQKKMLRDQYLENLRDGLKPKEAMKKALQIVLCFIQ